MLEMHKLVFIDIDASGLDALEHLQRTLHSRNVRLLLCAVNEQPLQLIRQARGREPALHVENFHPTSSRLC
jgi:SulP family sulfate permease